MNKYINVTHLAHLSNGIKSVNIDFFLEISCSGSKVSLLWYHKGSIVHPALTADPALTPYYPTAEEIPLWKHLIDFNAAKLYFETKKINK